MESDRESQEARGRLMLTAMVRWLTGRDRQPTLAPPDLPVDWKVEHRGPVFVALHADARALRDAYPAMADHTIAAADRIRGHRFTLLGRSDFVPRDPSRPAANGYQPIDWATDPAVGRRFPVDIPCRTFDLATMQPPGADVKLPWELARCQHLPVLGQAWRLTGDAEYAREVVRQFDDFAEANPWATGVNWACTMDVALRALNWALASELIADSPEAGALPRLYGRLFEHGAFVRDHLENQYEVTSNHYLSNLAGLLFVGVVFHRTSRGRQWLEFARAALEEEIVTQVLPDGADYESSVPYHRLVTELFLTSLRQGELAGLRFSAAYRDALVRMVEFLHAVQRPDGLMPQVGDADDGRAHILTGYGRWNPQDPRHLLGPAALVLSRPEWLESAGEEARWEAEWWGLRPALRSTSDAPLPDVGRLFPDAGLAVCRRGGSYLLVTNGIVGTKGFGNHKHNDQLGFEYHYAGQPVFVDPGSYVYTSDPDARNLFRSTAAHNTLMIDDVEQNDIRPEWLFRMFECARPEHLGFHSDGETVYEGRHAGYTRLPDPVEHRRRFRLMHSSGRLEISDTLSGSGEHTFLWSFHCGDGTRVSTEEDGRIRLAYRGATLWLCPPPDLIPAISSGWYSPSYGVRRPIAVVRFETRAALDMGVRQWTFAVEPEAR
jgi:uncharacterized heparinase superfamily protein